MVQAFAPVIFSTHFYGQWGGNEDAGCGPGTWDAVLRAYIEKIRSLGLALIAGEVGARPLKSEETWAEGGSWNATQAVLRVLPDMRVGILAWHGDAGSAFDLINPDGSWTDFRGDTMHNGLTPLGRGLYDYAQAQPHG
jgi:hypothetical protein